MTVGQNGKAGSEKGESASNPASGTLANFGYVSRVFVAGKPLNQAVAAVWGVTEPELRDPGGDESLRVGLEVVRKGAFLVRELVASEA